MSVEVQWMRFHGPAWELDYSTYDEYGDRVKAGALYQVWAPQDGRIRDPHGFVSSRRRSAWAASWNSADGEDGDFKRADDAASVLAIFPAKIRAAFTRAIEEGSCTT